MKQSKEFKEHEGLAEDYQKSTKDKIISGVSIVAIALVAIAIIYIFMNYLV